jgi:hypothetical protein
VVHVFPALANKSLLSVRKLCNEGYSVTFTIDNVNIFNKIGKEILKGNRDLDTGLWCINLHKEIQHNTIASSINVYELRNTGALVNYSHKEMFSPTKAAFVKAIKQGHLAIWPGLAEDAINKHLKLAPATAMGHMNQKRQNIRSTSKAVAITSDLEDTTVTPSDTRDKTHFVYAAVIDHGQLYTDLTGRFPQRSSKGNWYVMMVYSFDCNYIKPVAMKSKSASEWLKAFGEIFQELTSRGFNQNIQTLDNEASVALTSYFTENDMTNQLVPPHCHRQNSAECTIRNFKEHFMPGLASVDPYFPIHFWDRLLPQAEITLNLLRTSRLHPQLSTADHFHGHIDYNKTAFAPPGC